jgi:hypothetical protein
MLARGNTQVPPMPRPMKEREAERHLPVLFLEGTSRVFPIFDPLEEAFPVEHKHMRLERLAAEKTYSALSNAATDSTWFCESFTLECWHLKSARKNYSLSKLEKDLSGDANLFTFYFTSNESYTPVFLEKGSRFGRIALLTRAPSDSLLRYGTPVEAIVFDDPAVMAAFEMPITPEVMVASKITLEHIRQSPLPPVSAIKNAKPSEMYEKTRCVFQKHYPGSAPPNMLTTEFFIEACVLPPTLELDQLLSSAHTAIPWVKHAELKVRAFMEGFDMAYVVFTIDPSLLSLSASGE